MRTALFSTTCLAGLFAIATPTSAQTGAASQPVPPAASVAIDPAAPDQQLPATPPSASASATQRGEEIIVTGSRISRRDFQSTSPIATINSAAIAASGQPSLDRVIGQLPQFAAAQGASEVGDAQGAIGFAGGQSYSDLRGLGPTRSLVLLDGRRMMSSSPDGSIDLNTIPTAMIDSVEIITGGASAAYGSDAVAGVVNFKLRQKFTGLELNIQHGSTTRGDGRTNQISGIVGGSFAEGRGHAVLAMEYSDRATVEGSTRPFFANIRQLARPPEGIIAVGGFGGGAPTIAAVNGVLATYPGTTAIGGSGKYLGAIGVNTDGTIFTDLASTKTITNCVQNFRGLGTIKGINISPNCNQVQVALGNYFAVQVPLKKYNLFARGDYQIGDHVTAYGQFNFMESSAIDQTAPGSSKTSAPLLVPQNSPFVTGNAGLQAILSSISPPPTGNIIVTKLLTAFGNRVEKYKYDVWQAVAGLKGDIPGTQLHWDVYGSLGHSQFVNTVAGDVSASAVNKILDGTANYTGSAGSCVGYAWNPFGNNPLSPGCLEFAGRTDHNVNTQKQKIVEATLEGPLFALPAGDLRFALGADHRETSFSYSPDSTLVTKDSLPFSSTTFAAGKQKVSELFGELLVPILKDRPFTKELSLDLGYRYSHYSRLGNNSTYKIDATWAPIDAIRFRGGYSVAVRVPSLLDLYGPATIDQQNIGPGPSAGDPCAVNSSFRTGPNASQVLALCAAQGIPAAILPAYTYGSVSVPGSNGSNPDLKPEKAKTWSVGVVLAPKFNSALFRNFQMSVDYYNIKIANAIGSLNLTDILPRCFNSDGASNPTYSLDNPYCQRITRETNGGTIALGRQGLFNFATYTVSGIDAQLNWRFGLDALGLPSRVGSLGINSLVSYLKNYKVAGLLGSPTLNYAGSVGYGGIGGDISHPKWKANTSLNYLNGGFSAALHWRYIDKMIHVDKVANAASSTPGVPAYSYFDADAHYVINRHFTVGVGVTNIGNKVPPFVTNASLTTDAALYDVIGRAWYASLKAKF
ncbi:MAG: TonB-dependent receptor [Sphingomicrobium sp.]